ncbi:hypothetical protein PQI07_22700 [Methylobacterium sp. 092160098-2]|uniref:hypothetical protein n=1 Tax=Methylobacterium sp. 092160098-2 TaxID=3025129 RepID=UPI00238193AB|nr:hypothetical protein [Methylobacterium sp. 092160098-2]MDE4913494.1 hypothetical protein [Methylobacterium sp. 092160098-2]
MSTVQRGRPPEHGLRNTATYRAWAYIRAVVNNPNRRGYATVGGAGLKHDPRWDEFSEFVADMGECPEGHCLRRHDASKGFDAGNCFWHLPARKD